MVARQGDGELADELHAAIACFDRRTPRSADGQNGGMRRIDDGRKFPHAVHAEIGNRTRATLIFVRPELLMARTLGKIAHLRGDRGERFGLGIAYYRRDQPPLERDRHTDVGMLKTESTVARPYRIG